MIDASNRTRSTVQAAIRRVLATTYACDENAFLADGVHITLAYDVPGRMRFPLPPAPLMVAAMGRGVVVSCSRERMDWMQAVLGKQTRDGVFSAPLLGELARLVARDGQELHGPILRFSCSRSDLRPAPTPAGLTLGLVEGAAVSALYRYGGFDNALSYRRDATRPDVLATVMRQGDRVVGIAAASADHALLWQIGVEVDPDFRSRGIGRALVGRLATAILDANKLPYYSTRIAHLGSQVVALSLGFWPAWTDVYVRDLPVR